MSGLVSVLSGHPALSPKTEPHLNLSISLYTYVLVNADSMWLIFLTTFYLMILIENF